MDSKTIKGLIKNGQFDAAFLALCSAVKPEQDFTTQYRFARLFASIPHDALDLKPVRVAFAATSTVEHFIEIFRLHAAMQGFLVIPHLAEFNTIHQTVLDPLSSLYEFKPDIVWLFTSHRDAVIDVSPGRSAEEVDAAVLSAVQSYAALWDMVRDRASAHVIMNNADVPAARIFGNFEAAVPWSRQSVLVRFNQELARACGPGVTIFDLDHLSSLYGKSAWCDERYWYHSKHGFAPDANGLVAFRAARLLGAVKGRARKCLVLDLDNTLWGGVIGDDGLEGIRIGSGADGEAFADFQTYVLALARRGIILAVCSKNDEDNAKRPFLEHPDMRLRLEDFAVFMANWNDKAANIREIAGTLDIGLDSLVFVDDNPFERDLVKGMLPMVAVPDMPEDPALYIRTLDARCYFETVAFSREDRDRGAMYRSNAERKTLQAKYTNMDDYLRDLNMEAEAGPIQPGSLARTYQLINKSNQFHLTTTRYSEAAIARFMNDPGKICLQFRLKDRLGDNGLICVVILEERDARELLVDTWVMSCRVLSRNMEEFVCNELVTVARARGFEKIIGRYIPTKKNKIVENHYARLGFSLVRDDNGTTEWELIIDKDTPERKHFIRRAE